MESSQVHLEVCWLLECSARALEEPGWLEVVRRVPQVGGEVCVVVVDKYQGARLDRVTWGRSTLELPQSLLLCLDEVG